MVTPRRLRVKVSGEGGSGQNGHFDYVLLKLDGGRGICTLGAMDEKPDTALRYPHLMPRPASELERGFSYPSVFAFQLLEF